MAGSAQLWTKCVDHELYGRDSPSVRRSSCNNVQDIISARGGRDGFAARQSMSRTNRIAARRVIRRSPSMTS